MRPAPADATRRGLSLGWGDGGHRERNAAADDRRRGMAATASDALRPARDFRQWPRGALAACHLPRRRAGQQHARPVSERRVDCSSTPAGRWLVASTSARASWRRRCGRSGCDGVDAGADAWRPDHVGGAGAVIDPTSGRGTCGRACRCPGVPLHEPRGWRRPRRARMRHAHRRRCDARRHRGPRLDPAAPDWKRRRVRNDDSIVMEVRLGDVSIVLPGDIGPGSRARDRVRFRAGASARAGRRTSRQSLVFVEPAFSTRCSRRSSWSAPDAIIVTDIPRQRWWRASNSERSACCAPIETVRLPSTRTGRCCG